MQRAWAVALVVVAGLAGGWGALEVYTQERELSVGKVRLNAELGHRGALDLYVPLVDWGVRFEAVRFPARLRVDLRTVDREVLARVARGGALDVEDVRREAREVISDYIRSSIAIAALSALALAVLVALAARGGRRPRLRWTLGTAAATAVGVAAALLLTLPPKGTIEEPQYYAFGPDIPRALEAVATVREASRTLDAELDAQLVGLARLVGQPAGRPPLGGQPRLTVASDLHNNALAVPVLERIAEGAPLLFPGDLTDRGSPLETELVRRIVRAGKPFVFVSGNHDSDALVEELADDGAIVLTRARGIVRVAGLRMAGFEDPFERRSSEEFRDRFTGGPSEAQQQEFADWLRPLVGRVDVVMLHDPELARRALEELRASSPVRPFVIVTGHTHAPSLERIGPVTVLNGGSIGAGGTGNLSEDQDHGVARLIFQTRPFQPLAADIVRIDPGDGSATARRERLG